ncbi:MAG TPA: tripartite tricarboxylate transporter permease [Micropepsaceae bacterium]|nr:tripartite tricarboxylate transporter permease [Micropepsaceae bacterium]
MDFAVAVSSLVGILTSPYLLGLMMIGVLVGIFMGIAPGVGGKLGLVLLIPFVYGMDPLAGAVFLLSMHAVVHTAGAVTSILIGVPGEGATAATVLDGFAMTKNGEPGRALGASFGASLAGSIAGAVFLGASLGILEPVILSFSPAEFFLLAILGITFIATLSGKSVIKGLVVGLFGLMISFVGLDPSTGSERFTGGQLFLWDGVDIITAILAMFAIPEMISLGVTRQTYASDAPTTQHIRYDQVRQGLWDVVRHRWLVLRVSLLVAAIGVIPGLGGDAASWIAYGHTVQSSKHPERFGKGEVAGVIGAETGTCAKEGGSLLPTLFFGVPGSSGMAIMLGAFLMLGLQPGPAMLTEHLNIVWSLIWSLMVANIICVAILLAAAPWISRLAYVKTSLMVPIVLLFAILGSYLGHNAWQNLVLIIFLGGLGYLLKRHDWPRAPFVIGVILGKIAEDSLLKAMAIWGYSFFLRPISLVLIAMIIGSIVFYIWRQRNPRVGIVHG